MHKYMLIHIKAFACQESIMCYGGVTCANSENTHFGQFAVWYIRCSGASEQGSITFCYVSDSTSQSKYCIYFISV